MSILIASPWASKCSRSRNKIMPQSSLKPSTETSAASFATTAATTAAASSFKQNEKIAYENNKLHKRLCRQVGQAIGDFNMIEDGDTVMVCLSGGKASYALLDILITFREISPLCFVFYDLMRVVLCKDVS